MTTKSNEKHLTKKELVSAFWRSFMITACFSMDRMQAAGFDFAMIPVLKKLYGDNKEKYSEALTRHAEAYNNTYACTPFVVGIASAMEEEAANNPSFDTSSINNIKVALMGPLSGIGDTFFWGTFRILAAGVGISFAQQGSLLGPLLFLLIFNIPNFLVRIFGIKYGYRLGGKSIDALVSIGLMARATKAATVLGLVVIGGMIASMVYFSLSWVITMGDITLNVQTDFLDAICPKLLPLLLTFGCYGALQKNVKPALIMVLILAMGVLFKLLHIM